MASGSREIICTACGAETFVKREPVYEGFKKVGERFRCAGCGYEFASEQDIPFKEKRESAVFSDEDRSREMRVFRDDEKGHNCRHCAHYVVNPFVQRCGLHHKEVQATDTCPDFQKSDRLQE